MVFKKPGAVARAVYKGAQVSNNLNAFSNSSQRKFVRTSDGHLHMVYEDMGKVWYEISTDNGLTWQLANGAKPLSGSNQGKLPAIDYNGNVVVIVWQEQDAAGYDIKLAKFSSAGNYWYGSTVFTDVYLPYSTNTTPVVSWDGEDRMLVVWKRDPDNVGTLPTGLVYSYGALSTSGWNEMDFGGIPNTDSNSINPTLATNKTYSIPSTYHLAWEQTAGSYSYIKYFELYRDGYQKIQTTTSSPETPSSGAGFWTNRKPSITAMDDDTPRLVWVGFAPWYGSRAVLRAKQSNGSWSSTIYNYSVYSNVASANINRTDDGNYALGFFDASTDPELKYVKSSNLWQINSSVITGKDVQVSNAANFTNMYATAFQTNGTPYTFVQTSFSTMPPMAYQSNGSSYPSAQTSNPQQLPQKISDGRAAAVIKNGVEFIYALGDVAVNDEKIDFSDSDIDSSNQITSLAELSRHFDSKPFLLDNNSNLTITVFSAITDSAAALKLLKGDKQVTFQVKLIDAASGLDLGSFLKLTFNAKNTEGQNIRSYKLNTKGIGNRRVKLKLSINENIAGEYVLSKVIGANKALPLAKGGFPEAPLNANSTVTDYALAQNYPNPFNPTTTIRFTLPQREPVKLVIYAITGQRVATLVNEEMSAGTHQVRWNGRDQNGRSAASGVYIYQLFAGKQRLVKKMLLLK